MIATLTYVGDTTSFPMQGYRSFAIIGAMFQFRAFIILLLISLSAAGCQSGAAIPIDTTEAVSTEPVIEATSTNKITITPTRTPVPDRPTSTATLTVTAAAIASEAPTQTPTPSEWTEIAEGIEERYVPVALVPEDEGLFFAYALRINPASVTFQIHYEAGFAQKIDQWQASTGASIVVNGGFFTGEYTPVGRIVQDGTMFGFPLNYGERTIGVAGLFAVLDNEVSMYALGRSSYTPHGMRFDQAMESYPLLLLPGRQPTYPTETNETARRTLIGIDDQGYVIILVCAQPLFTLHNLSGWLAESDLNLDTALNLDGGRSTGIAISLPGRRKEISAYVDLPIVLAIYTK
jgi:uncharacterized protein YigE (DUF2233 family)